MLDWIIFVAHRRQPFNSNQRIIKCQLHLNQAKFDKINYNR
jgi:hypothetical protein